MSKKSVEIGRYHAGVSRDFQMMHDRRIVGPALPPYARYSNNPPMQDDKREYRYEETDHEYRLRCWYDGRETSHMGLLYDRPEWLKNILVTARVAGAVRPVREPPPELILWFRTDESNNLDSFIDMWRD